MKLRPNIQRDLAARKKGAPSAEFFVQPCDYRSNGPEKPNDHKKFRPAVIWVSKEDVIGIMKLPLFREIEEDCGKAVSSAKAYVKYSHG